MSLFGWDYPPGVTGNEPEITGDYYTDECTKCGELRDLCPDCGACEDCPCCGNEEDEPDYWEIEG